MSPCVHVVILIPPPKRVNFLHISELYRECYSCLHLKGFCQISDRYKQGWSVFFPTVYFTHRTVPGIQWVFIKCFLAKWINVVQCFYFPEFHLFFQPPLLSSWFKCQGLLPNLQASPLLYHGLFLTQQLSDPFKTQVSSCYSSAQSLSAAAHLIEIKANVACQSLSGLDLSTSVTLPFTPQPFHSFLPVTDLPALPWTR